MYQVVPLLLVFHTTRMAVCEPAVSVADLDLFPSRERAWACYYFGVNHRDWLDHQSPQGSYEREQWYRWQEDHRHCLQAWSALADAWGQVNAANPLIAEKHLERLRRILGRNAYWQGEMPPPCPWWRFEKGGGGYSLYR